ncbi:NACHT, LRR and PYD domains-containing protein 1a-like isoform X1 [Coturnix japonica]|uniref:NACHT, LRR and PYD domains-containing protein 1a-like isoform X1 n=1 Tax=Coturnix japonica TaxID=93934 RepID=UPI0013A5E022|nr:NACHT, LRR and PYD domains-containing protein 1a-like isoform X1 [Coturnix japonica]XP_032303831.1 NACHT, LRR and PYD domains-containing protein 1a-like isoform X1 [Coturnix japonica]
METTSSSTFPISVTSELGKNISVPVSLDDTVLDLNMKLFAMDSCFYPSQSRLVHDGQRLMNEQTLRHYNITSNSSIQQFHKSRGGGSAALEGKEDVSVRGGGSAALEGKEDVSATDNQERIYQADSSRSSSMVILHGGSAHADLTIETKSLLAGITSTSVEELQKRPQSDVPAQERSCRCVRQKLQRVMPEVDPHFWREPKIYKACLPGPGIFQCSETGLAFEVESAATIVYRYADWRTHLKETDQNLWEPAGPLFNIWVLPGTVQDVYLPHFICVSNVDTSGCSIAHFEFEKMTIQQPKKVMAFTAVLENPSFSLLGVVWRKLRSAISLPVHSLVLIFQQLSAANTTLHLYLIPDDISVRQAIERREMSWNSRLIPKPPPFTRLFFGYRYKVSSKPKVKIKPEPHLPFCYKES